MRLSTEPAVRLTVCSAAEYATEIKSVDEATLFALARCAGAQITPVCSFVGGVVGQEVMRHALWLSLVAPADRSVGRVRC
jgi:hypothetical protein